MSAALPSIFIRFWRLAMLAAAVLVIREHVQQRSIEEAVAAIQPDRLRDFFPEAAALGSANPTSGWRPVYNLEQNLLGYIATTAPESDKIIGYSGPTNSLLAFTPQGTLIGFRILKSHDTSDHLAEVIADRKFFLQFKDQKPGGKLTAPIHTVTGATLTSAAIAQGVMNRLGQSAATSLRFPDEITLAEVQSLHKEAAALKPSPRYPGGHEVFDAKNQRIGVVVRTSPIADPLIGYKGPTDTLMLLDAEGAVLKKIALRRSYDTKRYVGYVTGDSYFLNLFNERPLEALADLDMDKVEGVSGATDTSRSMAEGLKKRAENLLTLSPTGWLRNLQWRWQDWGHIAVLVAAFVMAYTRLRGRAWIRHCHHALLVLYVGFIAAELLSQGLLTGWAAHGTPWQSAPGLVLLGAVALLGPTLTRKQLYCHHICPHGAFQQLLARRVKKQWRIPSWLDRKLSQIPLILLGLIFIAVVYGWSLDLNDLEPFDAYVFRVAGWASIVLAVLGLTASLFTPLAYCKYGCPTGALFKLVRFTGDADKIGIRDWLAAILIAITVLF